MISKLVLSFTIGVVTATLDKRRNGNRHNSNTLGDRLKTLDRKLYEDGKRRADVLEGIKKSWNEK